MLSLGPRPQNMVHTSVFLQIWLVKKWYLCVIWIYTYIFKYFWNDAIFYMFMRYLHFLFSDCLFFFFTHNSIWSLVFLLISRSPLYVRKINPLLSIYGFHSASKSQFCSETRLFQIFWYRLIIKSSENGKSKNHQCNLTEETSMLI